MDRNRIKITGFGSNCEPEPGHEPKGSKKEKSVNEKMIEVMENYIRENYMPLGVAEDKMFKSSARLQYELREFYPYSLSEICKVMEDAGYKVEFLNGVPFWVVYEVHRDIID